MGAADEELSVLERAIKAHGADAVFGSLTDAQREALQYAWEAWARPKQLAPGLPGSFSNRTDWRWFLILAGRGFGKGLALNTPIPTPGGWSTMGDLRDGSEVLDECGRACRVVKAHDPYEPVRCYRLRLSDGTEIVADGCHLWKTWTRADRDACPGGIPDDWPAWIGPRFGEGPRIRTTDLIAETLSAEHSIPVNGRHVHILSAERIEPRTVRCITVDSRHRLYLAGEGMIPTHNTRTAAEEVRRRVNVGYRRIALVGRTAADVRDVIVGGESGILAVFPPNERPTYEPSKRRITFANGAIATTYSADKPDQLRGPQHDFAMCDELAAWARPEAFKQVEFGLRLGDKPQGVIATTPRPLTEVPILERLLKRRDVVTVRGSTFENTGHLPSFFLEAIKAEYEGTSLGQQELYAVIIDAIEGALWTQSMIQYEEPEGETFADQIAGLDRIVIGVDPAGSSHKKSDFTGIVVAGRKTIPTGEKSVVQRGYTLADLTMKAQPRAWATRVVEAYRAWEADCVIAEVNNGGEMVKEVIHSVDRTVPVKMVRASRGKEIRATPVSAIYAQGRWFHARPFPELEAQMTSWSPDPEKRKRAGLSPDRVDALVYTAHELLISPKVSTSVGVTVIG